MKYINKTYIWVIMAFVFIIGGVLSANAQVALPSVNLSFNQANTPEEFSKGLQILVLLTILTVAPSIIIMTTSFTRMVIVLSLARQAIGTGQLPPSQVIVGLAMILTFFVMAPTINEINTKAFHPYMNKQITQQDALKKGLEPLRQFMFRQTKPNDLALFVNLSKIKKPKTTADIPTYVLLPSFIVSEMNTAFKIGFMIFIPFLIIDIVISSILVSMGMLFLPPAMISMPFKIILFVMIDGWYLITQSLVAGFN